MTLASFRSASLAAALAAVGLWSAWKPADMLTWWLESLPVLLALPLLFATRRRFPLSLFAYGVIALHGVVLFVGAHYTYAEMPLFNTLRDALDLSRNHYDRLGHFLQGFTPAMLARELLVRTSPLKRGGWLFFCCMGAAMSVSAFYELLEWWAALAWGGAAEAFLATQGDVWDTQKDMFMALLGASAYLLLFLRMHARSMEKIPGA